MLFRKPLRLPGHVLIRVVEASVNPVDWKFRKTPQWPLVVLPAITGRDFAGIVEEADEHSRFERGDRVLGMLPTVTRHWGSFADFVAVNEEFVAHMPEGLSFAHAAALPLVGLTAIQAFALAGPAIMPGAKILIHAGAGGVGSFAIQYAKRVLGMEVWTTSMQRALCEGLGADRVIEYRKEKFEDVAGGKPIFDVVIDLMGGDYFVRTYPLVKPTGVYVDVLNSGWETMFGTDLVIPVMVGLSGGISHALHMLGLGPKYALCLVVSDGKALEAIAKLVADGTIRMLVDQEFNSLDEAGLAHDRSQFGNVHGKVLLKVRPT